uniref:OTU domain-containing protein 4 n=1 Tax=Sphenodon punctatus TaxID=8508 RepID=A0A8D0GY42_SPHPU
MEATSKPDGEEHSHPGSGMESTGDASMDSYLRSQGFYRKRVAKDGSCLFRAVAEQVFHSQSQHIDIRIACINYLLKNRGKFEAFIEGPFEGYLKGLENPQEWVGQVEISALSLMYKKDFIIYREPNSSPSLVTENGFPDKILLCFSNGNHYDIVYPIGYTDRAALCQSLLYELLYERVFDTNVSKTLAELDACDVTDDDNGSSEASDSDSEDDGCRSQAAARVNDMNELQPLSGNKHPRNSGKSTTILLPKKVLKSLNPSVYRNIEYEVWLQSKRDQQKRDFSIAAGLQYSVGDKCKVRLDNNGKLYNAHIQDVHSENGPVVVFVEELGAKHSVSLKSLKPLLQASVTEGWNTVTGKKVKKLAQPEVDCRGPKDRSKPIKAQSVLPPRLQHAVGSRQHHFPSSGLQPQQTPNEQKTPGRNPPQAMRKSDHERTEVLGYPNRDCNYFGLSPEERREKQAIEESRSLYEIQHRDEQAFPALSNQSVCQVDAQPTDACNQRKLPVVNERRNGRRRSDVEERKAKDSGSWQTSLDQKCEPTISEKNGDHDKHLGASPPPDQGKAQSPSPAEQKLTEHLLCVNPAPPPVFPELHLPPAVPSLPAIVPAWPSEPATYGPTGIPSQIPVSSLLLAPTSGPDSVVSQAQVASSAAAGVPVPMQAVNQPLMPLPQTLNPYQDPLYPGFPFNEKGERAIAPYSLCGTGDDLPNDKNILRFFFNLGVKAYSCPMWAPHSYLYPLHQAYLTTYRMYPKVPVPVCPHNPWLQESSSTQTNSETIQANCHFPMQNEAIPNGRSPQVDNGASPLPLFIPAAQLPESQGPMCIQSENPVQALPGDYESLGGKSMFPQPPFGHNPYLGAVPIAPPFFPHFWYGYPFQSFVESSVVSPNVGMAPEDKGATAGPSVDVYLAKECSSPAPIAECMELLQEANSECNSSGLPLSVTSTSNECNAQNETSTRVPKVKQASTVIPPATQVKSGQQNLSAQTQGSKRQMVTSTASPSTTEQPKNELSATPSHKEKTDKVRESKGTDNLAANVAERRSQRAREESSEDESEVSDMLRSGRSKQYFNQTYGGGRRPRNDWGYPSGRGGYQYPRNEENWKGPPNRSREEGYQYHRNRGRPYRRRAAMGDSHRGQQT